MRKKITRLAPMVLAIILACLVSLANPWSLYADTMLLGTTTVGTANGPSGFIAWQGFTASASGNCTYERIYCLVNSNVRVAIYSDNAGHPGNLLNESASTAITSGDWRNVTIPATAIINGTFYWLAVQCETSGGMSYTVSANPFEFQVYAYNTFPATGAGAVENDTLLYAFQGWAIGLPTVTSSAATNVEETTATANGNITATGGENNDERGTVWDTSTHADPGNVVPPATYSDNLTEYGSFGISAFTSNLTGLAKGEEYFYRTFSHNSVGYDYSDTERTFLTKPDAPTAFTATGGVVSGRIALAQTLGTGAQKHYIRGKIGSYPTDRTDGVLVYSDNASSYNYDGLTGGDHWYFNCYGYATEGGLEQWSDACLQDNATAVTVPLATTSAATLVEETTATLNGNVTGTGGSAVTDKGFEWDVDSGAPYAVSWTDGVGGTGAYTYAGAVYNKGTLYYYRSKGQNALGWGYGSEVTFLTKPDPPSGLVITVTSSTQLTLSWTAGTGAGSYMVRYKDGVVAPTSTTDGTFLYSGIVTGYGHTGLDPGETISYSVWGIATGGGWTKYSDSYISGTATTSSSSIYLDNFKYYIPITITSQCSTQQELRIPFIINSAGLSTGGFVLPSFDDAVLARVDTIIPLTVTDISATTLYKSSETTSTSDNSSVLDTTLTQADDYWNGCTIEITETTDGLAPQGESKTVLDYVQATDNISFAAMTAVINDGDLYDVGNYRSKYFTNITLEPYQQIVLNLYTGYAGVAVAERELCTDAGDSIYVAHNADYNITDNLTVIATAKLFALPSAERHLVSKDGAYELGIDAANKPYFKLWHPATDNATGASALVVDTNYILTGTYNDASDNITIYVDGSVAGSKADASGAISTTANNIILANLDNGEVDDIEIGWASLIAPTYVLNLQMEASHIGEVSILDQSAAAHNATVAWDITLPSCITVDVGAVTEVETWVSPGGTEQADLPVFELPTEPSNWDLMGNRAIWTNLPAYDLMTAAATQLGWSDATMYRIMVIFTAIGVAVAIGIATASALLTAVACGVILAMGAGAGIVGWALIVLYAIFAGGYIVASRSM